MTRKVSDVILSLESDVQNILHYLKSIDFKLSTLMNAKAEILSNTESIPSVSSTEDVPSIPETNNKLFTIRQKILYSDDESPVRIAKVQVFNSNGDKVKETRTGPSGKWEAKLPAGTYKVRIQKSKINNYPHITKYIDINVVSGKELQLLEDIKA